LELFRGLIVFLQIILLQEARMSKLTFANKCGLLAGAAMLISAMAVPAHAQNVPPGSYLQSCRNVETQGDRLVPTVAEQMGVGAEPPST
jgi:hypothetical protein